ncbi:putative pentatricopeptide repeat-containing protein [Camellia lanceoleosa]|uniref:Pentatricopeptide repeat-containing protein n=1 Tax=Camellia lanceoleosa TaxID=1840588 RepID=A0ACC0IUN5_9ERIC|nr:putative pentatricopeptide repeat-containing protein [Camellia lanceoleosa]
MERLKGYSEKLGVCALKVSLDEGKAIHGQVIKNAIDPDMHLSVSLINFYAKCHVFNFARQVLDEMPERDVVSWTALISGLVADGYGNDCIYLFSEMRNEGIRPNEFSLATCLRGGSICLDLEFGKQVHAEVIKLGFFLDIYVGSALVDLYAKCGEMEYADKVFFCMPKQNDVRGMRCLMDMLR